MQRSLDYPDPTLVAPHSPTPFSARGEHLIRGLIRELGEDPAREGLLDTPSRVWSALQTLTDGYDRDALEVVGDALFEEPYDEMVLVRDVEFFSLCEHHMLPFFGKVHVAYIPNGRVVGLSKIPRIVDLYSHRLQVQERLTTQIADALGGVLRPRGVGVVVEASHLCMMMRGVEKQHSQTTTSAMRGQFKEDQRTRSEFLDLIKRG